MKIASKLLNAFVFKRNNLWNGQITNFIMARNMHSKILLSSFIALYIYSEAGKANMI